jgi:hypothetical protein
MNRNKNPSNKESIFHSYKAQLLLKLRSQLRLLELNYLATPAWLFSRFSWYNEYPVQRGVGKFVGISKTTVQ